MTKLERIARLEEIIATLEYRILNLEHPELSQPFIREAPSNKCPTCNIEFSGTMGYVCNRTDCPMIMVSFNSTTTPTG